MPAIVIKMVKNREAEQTGRFRWSESFNGYYVTDTVTGETKGMGDGVDMFSPVEEEDMPETDFALVPGTQRFYDCLNAYFENEQAEVGKEYFDVEYMDERPVATAVPTDQ